MGANGLALAHKTIVNHADFTSTVVLTEAGVTRYVHYSTYGREEGRFEPWHVHDDRERHTRCVEYVTQLYGE